MVELHVLMLAAVLVMMVAVMLMVMTTVVVTVILRVKYDGDRCHISSNYYGCNNDVMMAR